MSSSTVLDVMDALLYTAPLYIALGLAMTIGSTLLFRHFRGTPTALLVVGAAIYTAGIVFQASIGPVWVRRHTVMVDIADSAPRLAAICFAVGFVWFAVRAKRGKLRSDENSLNG